jgi:hypothetical protein
MISATPPLWLNGWLHSSSHLIAAHSIARPLWDVDNTSAAALSREIRYDGQQPGIPLIDINSKTVIYN